MNSKRSLLTLVIGLAMLATPITAAAYDNGSYANDNAHNKSRPAHVSRSSNAPAHSYAPARNGARADATRRDSHNNAVAVNRNMRADRTLREADAYRNYGRPGYYRDPAYPVAVPRYGAPGYAVARPGYVVADPCRQARSIVYNYYRDRNTGHPAAAADLLAQNQWAFRSGCGGTPVGGPVFSGFGGVPAGYNGGYGQPYGGSSFLGPLIQQFIR